MGEVITFFDTETTDLTMPEVAPLDRQPRVIELGFITDYPGGRQDIIDCLIDPGIPLPAEITKITGITNRDLRGKDPISKWIPTIRDTLEASDIVVAHNLSFDKSLLEYEFQRAEAGPVPWPKYQVCTVEATEHLKGHRLDLDSLYHWCFNKTPKGSRHRALEDSRFTAEIYYHLMSIGEM